MALTPIDRDTTTSKATHKQIGAQSRQVQTCVIHVTLQYGMLFSRLDFTHNYTERRVHVMRTLVETGNRQV